MPAILSTNLADTALISQLLQKNTSAWAQVYDTYAAMMDGIILNMTGDETMAEEILEHVFTELNTQQQFLKTPPALVHTLLKHTYKSTLTYLETRGLTPINAVLNNDYPLTHSFYFEEETLQEVAQKHTTHEHVIVKNLQKELKQLRNQA
jgi:DNA-directed RNA polymerase specialized sigma24 family protein